MEKLKAYTVIKSSTDRLIKVGDIIWLSENGDLNSVEGRGWLTKEEWDIEGTNDFVVEVCKTHYLDISNGSELIRRL